MKKQILIMMFLSLAFVFAGMNNAYGQVKTSDSPRLENAPECFAPDELICTTGGGELNPIPGHEYTYTVDDAGITDGTSVASIHWFVYEHSSTVPLIAEQALINTAGPQVDPGDGDGDFLAVASDIYNIPTAFTSGFSIDLTWKYFDPSREVLLVAYITGDECADNIEVYRIRPAFAFILDVASLMPDGSFKDENDYTVPADRCVSDVWSAAYEDNAGVDILNIDYGANYVYFLVSAANFGHSWKPTMSATHSENSTIASDDIQWAFPADAADADFTEWNSADEVVNAPGNGTVDEDGQCIVVRVLVEHGTVENADPSTVTLSVEGNMYNPSATGDQYADFHHLEDSGDENVDCLDDQPDTADYILTPRPKIEADTPAPFVPKDEPVTP